MKALPTTHSGLSPAAKKWWETLIRDYEIEPGDSAGLLLLEVAMRALDMMRAAELSIAEHGQVTMDEKGQLRPNPSCVILRDSRAAMPSAIKSLNFDVEPTNKVGRPSKG